MTSTVAAAGARSLGETLQRRRLEARAQRVEQVVAALEERVQVREAAGFVPASLRLAICDFRLQLVELRGRLALPHL